MSPFDPRSVPWEDAGISPEKAEELRAREYPDEWAWYWRLYLAGTMGGFLLALLGVWGLTLGVESLTSPSLEGALFVSSPFPWSTILILFGGMIACFIPLSYLDRIASPPIREYLMARNLVFAQRSPGAGGLLTRALYRRAAASMKADDPLEAWEAIQRVTRRWMGLPGVALMIVGALMMPVQAATYDRGTEAGIERHTLLGVERVPLSAIERVEVGCARGRQPVPHYHLVLRDGDDLHAWPTACDPACFWRMQRLHALMTRERVPVRAWSPHVGRSVDDRCIHDVARQAGVSPRDVRPIIGRPRSR